MRSFHWKRKLIYYYGKIVRDDGTPQYIARGWGIGMFIGCVIPMSFQLLISVPLSFLLRGSKIGATLGTLITNPVTVVFIYPVQCWVGNKLIGGDLSYRIIFCGRAAAGRRDDADHLLRRLFAGGALPASEGRPEGPPGSRKAGKAAVRAACSVTDAVEQ